MIKEVKKYRNYVNEIPKLISETHYKSSFFIELLELKKPTYYRKLKENSFNIDEVEQITKVLFPKEAYKEELMQSIEQGRADFEDGNVMTSEQVRAKMRKQIADYQ